MPNPSHEFAASLAADVFGVTGTLSPLHGEFDDNWRVESNDGTRCVLKVMSPDRARSLVDLQCAALDHLARREPGLALPRVHPRAAVCPSLKSMTPMAGAASCGC